MRKKEVMKLQGVNAPKWWYHLVGYWDAKNDAITMNKDDNTLTSAWLISKNYNFDRFASMIRSDYKHRESVLIEEIINLCSLLESKTLEFSRSRLEDTSIPNEEELSPIQMARRAKKKESAVEQFNIKKEKAVTEQASIKKEIHILLNKIEANAHDAEQLLNANMDRIHATAYAYLRGANKFFKGKNPEYISVKPLNSQSIYQEHCLQFKKLQEKLEKLEVK